MSFVETFIAFKNVSNSPYILSVTGLPSNFKARMLHVENQHLERYDALWPIRTADEAEAKPWNENTIETNKRNEMVIDMDSRECCNKFRKHMGRSSMTTLAIQPSFLLMY